MEVVFQENIFPKEVIFQRLVVRTYAILLGLFKNADGCVSESPSNMEQNSFSLQIALTFEVTSYYLFQLRPIDIIKIHQNTLRFTNIIISI